jgi:hypothetical protein
MVTPIWTTITRNTGEGNNASGVFVQTAVELTNGQEVKLNRLTGRGLSEPEKKVYIF